MFSLTVAKYIRKSIFHGKIKDIEINLQFQKDSLELKLKRAIPCGQLLNKLLINTFRHTLQNKNECLIKLKVSDNSCGIADKLFNEKSNSLGLTLINNFVRQLLGNLDIDNIRLELLQKMDSELHQIMQPVLVVLLNNLTFLFVFGCQA